VPRRSRGFNLVPVAVCLYARARVVFASVGRVRARDYTRFLFWFLCVCVFFFYSQGPNRTRILVFEIFVVVVSVPFRSAHGGARGKPPRRRRHIIQRSVSIRTVGHGYLFPRVRV